MAYRYRQLYPQDGDILDPDDWNLNNKELAEEFNGYLDRDNLPPFGIDVQRVRGNAFEKIQNFVHTDQAANRVVISGDTLEWQSGDGTNDIAFIDFKAPYDCYLICEFGGTWEVDTSIFTGDLLDSSIKFQILVDGDVVAITDDQAFSLWERDTVHLCGALSVLAGTHRVEVRCQVGAAYTDGTYGLKSTINTISSTDLDLEIGARELVLIERRR